MNRAGPASAAVNANAAGRFSRSLNVMALLNWEGAARIVNLAPTATDISTPRKFVDGQILAHTALLAKIKRLEKKVKLCEALLSN